MLSPPADRGGVFMVQGIDWHKNTGALCDYSRFGCATYDTPGVADSHAALPEQALEDSLGEARAVIPQPALDCTSRNMLYKRGDAKQKEYPLCTSLPCNSYMCNFQNKFFSFSIFVLEKLLSFYWTRSCFTNQRNTFWSVVFENVTKRSVEKKYTLEDVFLGSHLRGDVTKLDRISAQRKPV